jgi:hypothetical protein
MQISHTKISLFGGYITREEEGGEEELNDEHNGCQASTWIYNVVICGYLSARMISLNLFFHALLFEICSFSD